MSCHIMPIHYENKWNSLQCKFHAFEWINWIFYSQQNNCSIILCQFFLWKIRILIAPLYVNCILLRYWRTDHVLFQKISILAPRRFVFGLNTPDPFWKFQFKLMLSLRNFGLGISNDLLWWRYGYFLELHNNVLNDFHQYNYIVFMYHLLWCSLLI